MNTGAAAFQLSNPAQARNYRQDHLQKRRPYVSVKTRFNTVQSNLHPLLYCWRGTLSSCPLCAQAANLSIPSSCHQSSSIVPHAQTTAQRRFNI